MTTPDAEPAPDAAVAAGSATAPPADAGRLERWKRKLLDLTRRNPLLNFRENLKTVPLAATHLALLEDALANGAEFRLVAEPPPAATATAVRVATVPVEVATAALHAHRLGAPLSADELDRRLLEISRAERLSQEESGASTLFLALGFLRWYEAADSGTPNLAPVLLLPMTIERQSVREGFRISLQDAEPRINVTLLEKLHQDFGISIPGLDPLPEDESGLDVDTVLQRLRDAVAGMPQWELVETASLAILTFSKFLLWQDLECNSALLKQNPIVRHLLDSPGQPFPAVGALPAESDLDRGVDPAEIFCPLDADSSQIAAILGAERGVSFVLQGPPGTGKSQTITNLIAHCMAKGRRLLFVSEKMAALEVVQNRLERVGLGPFCMELHSRKANKHELRRQLEEALALERCLVPEAWPRATAQLREQQTALDAYVAALHARRPFGQSVFWALSRLVAAHELPQHDSTFGNYDTLTAEAADRVLETAKRLPPAAKLAEPGPGQPLRECRIAEWQLGREAEAARHLEALTAAAAALRQAAAAALPALRRGDGDWTLKTLAHAHELALCLLESPPVGAALVNRADWSTTTPALDSLLAAGRERDALETKLFGTFTAAVLEQPLDGYRVELREARGAMAPVRWWKRFCVRRQLRRALAAPAELTAEVMEDAVATGLALRQRLQTLATGARHAALFESHWNSGRPDWDLLARQVAWVTRYKDVVARAEVADAAGAVASREAWTALATEQRGLLVDGGPLQKPLRTYTDAFARYREALSAATAVLQPDPALPPLAADAADHLGTVTACAARWRGALAQLRPWCAYQGARAACVAAGFGPVVDLIESGDAAAEDFPRLAEKTFAAWCLRETLAREPVLARFLGAEQERRIRAFGELDRTVRDLARLAVFAALTQRLPAQALDTERFRSSEMGTLKRFVKGARGSIRNLFAQCPTALARLKPCVLMSPLSVAQFLGADFPRFDVVVFDEASQMPPWEAIGAIARANQVIVVGDSRQLPPTTFFARVVDPDDAAEPEEALVQDLESILDECQACHMPMHALKWHYRSKHESLIAFSNRHYYGNELVTFPSAADQVDGLGVRLRSVPDAWYDASRSRTNRGEAEALVAEVVAHLLDPRRRSWSLGVVTFSIAQQRLIEDLLETAREERPEIDVFFTDDVAEPVFVKNLETVQGDERDVMLFSICYGPDREGNVRMNFGPLNNRGGERRLNVAVTRARRHLLVFSTLQAAHIDLNRTDAVGVCHLKEFLAFAESGAGTPVVNPGSEPAGSAASPFEDDVRRALQAKGWDVVSRVGCAAYRMDVAVRHPRHRGCLVMGIQTDGESYRGGATARDRDRLRTEVLTGLGWRLTHVWSLEWLLRRAQETERLHREITDAVAAFDVGKSVTPGGGGNLPQSSLDAPATAPQGTAAPLPAAELKRVVVTDENRDGIADLPGQSPYRQTRLRRAPHLGPGFLTAAASAEIAAMARLVLNTESPLHADLLTVRLADAGNLTRVTRRHSERVRQVAEAAATVRDCDGRIFLWRKGQDPVTYQGFRVPDPADGYVREPEHLPPEEVANAAKQILHEHLGLGQDDLLKALATLFGFPRLTPRVREAMLAGVRQLPPPA